MDCEEALKNPSGKLFRVIGTVALTAINTESLASATLY